MRQRIDWLLVGLLAVSVAANIYLLGQRSAIATTSQAVPPQVVAVGDVLPSIEGVRITGTKTFVDFAGNKPTLVYVFSKTCTWCDRNATSIKVLLDSAASSYRVVALSTSPVSETDAIVKGVSSDFVIQPMSGEILRRMHMTTTPLTLLVESGGRVSHVWLGAFTSANRQSIEKTFGISLPEIISPSS